MESIGPGRTLEQLDDGRNQSPAEIATENKKTKKKFPEKTPSGTLVSNKDFVPAGGVPGVGEGLEIVRIRRAGKV